MVVGIIILCIVTLLFIASFITIRMFNKLSIRKIVSEGKYVNLDEAFIRRYEALPELLELCGGGETVSDEREKAIRAERAEERVEHDKLMCEALSAYRAEHAAELSEGRGAEICEALDALEAEIAEKYADYNSATQEYERLRNKPVFKPVVKFFSFEEKPLF
ncbi:MAG: hypothetical protein IKS88_03390 [Clostridia bacterium]|nr:hypothetical protein [Clostridia bacterium]